MKLPAWCLVVMVGLLATGCSGSGLGSSYAPAAPVAAPGADSPGETMPGSPAEPGGPVAPGEEPAAQPSEDASTPPGPSEPATAPSAPAAHVAFRPSSAAKNDGRSWMIADQFNNRVIEIDGTQRVVWSFGDGSSVAGPHSVVAPNDEERYGSLTLITGTGAAAGSEPACKHACPDDRVILVDRRGKIVWQYGKTGVAGSGQNELNAPATAIKLPSGNFLIADRGNQRVIEVTPRKRIAWQYGTTGKGAGRKQLDGPNSAQALANGNILIADAHNDRVIEVAHDKRIVWQYGTPGDTATLHGPAFASRLPNGNTLITDALNGRVVEVDANKHVVWTYAASKRAGVSNSNPTRAVRLSDGSTLIDDQLNHQVFVVDRTGAIAATAGKIGIAGNAPGELNAPYDAKAVGDFTGLTPP